MQLCHNSARVVSTRVYHARCACIYSTFWLRRVCYFSTPIFTVSSLRVCIQHDERFANNIVGIEQLQCLHLNLWIECVKGCVTFCGMHYTAPLLQVSTTLI